VTELEFSYCTFMEIQHCIIAKELQKYQKWPFKVLVHLALKYDGLDLEGITTRGSKNRSGQ
jgi:hypothetical protein